MTRGFPRPWLVVTALLAVYTIWGSTYLAIKVAVEDLPPMLLMAARFAVAGAALFAVSVRLGDRRSDRVTWEHLRHAVVTGGTLLVGGTGLVTLAQTRIASGTAALLTATVPVWLAVFARMRFGERLTPRAVLGLAVGMLGIAILVDPAGGGNLVAMLLAVAGAAAWAAGSVRGRTAAAPRRPLVAASLEMLGAVPVFVLVGVLLGEPARIDLATVSRGAWVALAYLVVAGSLVAFTAYSWLLRNASTQLVGTHSYVNPIVAVGLGWAFAGEVVSARTLLAGGVVLVGVVLLITGRPGVPVPAQATSGGDVFAARPQPRRVRHLVAVWRGSSARLRRLAAPVSRRRAARARRPAPVPRGRHRVLGRSGRRGAGADAGRRGEAGLGADALACDDPAGRAVERGIDRS